MRFACRDFSTSDMARRGVTPADADLAVLLVDIDAELSIRQHGRQVWTEPRFQVAELAWALQEWLRMPDAQWRDFEYVSMYDDDGAIRIRRADDGWCVGSAYTPDFWTDPVSWEALNDAVEEFAREVRDGVAGLGADPAFLRLPPGGQPAISQT